MNILLVEDDVGIGRVICQGLRARGIEVQWERVGKNVRSLVSAERFNTIILDLLLPDSDGLDLCSDIRKAGLGVPILVLTARADLDDRLDGFSAGADDYLAKPFAFQELIARVQALLKRDGLRKPDAIRLGDLTIDPNARHANWAGEPVAMAPRAFSLLLALVQARGAVVKRNDLIDAIWGTEAELTDNALDACASALRRCLGDVTREIAVEAVRGEGFALRLSERAASSWAARDRVDRYLKPRSAVRG